MTTFDKEELLRKYREGTCSKQELRLLEAWYNDWNMQPHITLSEAELLEAEGKMREVVMQRVAPSPIRLWPRIAVAASVILISALALILVKPAFLNSIAPEDQVAQGADIKPGQQGATLTLSNGQKINLDTKGDSALAAQGGLRVQKLANGQLVYTIVKDAGSGVESLENGSNTLSTSRGQTYQVQLPDGSLVWLNASSSLSYPLNIGKAKERRVLLQGEGYFEIAKDAGRPFLVQTPQSGKTPPQEIKVLGTHFNVSNYPEEPTAEITLLEGRIALKNDALHKELILRPGQQAIVNQDKVNIQEMDTESAVAWKNGYFQFDKAEVATVMNQLARWYNIEVKYADGVPGDHITGKVHRNANLPEALQILSYLGIKYNLQGRIITVEH